jgi:hypothetical protein
MTYWSSGNLIISSPNSLSLIAASTMSEGGTFIAKITVDGVLKKQEMTTGTGPYLNVQASYDLTN